MTVNDTDKFLVNRDSSSFHLEAQNLMAELLDDDLMLVNRANRSYSATGAEIKESLKPPADVVKPSIIAPADGAGEIVSAESDEIVSYVELDTDSGTGPGGIPNQTTSFDFDFGPYLISQGVTSITGFRLLDSGTNYSGLFEDIVIDGQSVITADRFVSQTGNVYQNNDTYSWETWFQSNAASYVQGENNDTSGYQCETQKHATN